MRSLTCIIVWQCVFFLAQSLLGQGKTDGSTLPRSWVVFGLQRRSCFCVSAPPLPF